MRFGTKIMLWVTLLLSLTFALGGSLLISMSFSNSISREKSSTLQAFQMILYTLQANGESNWQTTLVQMSHQQAGLELRLTGENGIVYVSEHGDVFSALASNFPDSGTATLLFDSTDEESALIVSGGFDRAGTRYQLDIYQDISDLYTARQSQLSIYWKLFAGVVILSTLASWFLSKNLTRPLRSLSLTARTISAGDLDSRANIHSGDEVEDLAEDFNQMADRLQAQMQELEAAMVRQDAFVGSFAHELKTPMTSLVGYSDLLQSHDLSEEERRQAAHFLYSESRRLESLSLKLLDLLVLQKKDFPLVLCSPAKLAQEAVEQLRPLFARRGINIVYRLKSGTCLLEPDLVKSLLLNLLDNAAKSMDGQGSIALSVELTEDGCTFQVGDTGRGMEPEELSRITEAFYRVDKSRSRAQGGAGLGLTLCKEIAAMHNGDIQFDSIPGKGTVVTVSLKGGRPS